MRILMLTWEYPPRIVGGISRVVYYLSRNLVEIGHTVSVFTCLDGGCCEFESRDGVTVHRVKAYSIHTNSFTDWVTNMNFAMIEKAVSTGEAESADIIHAHDWLVACTAKVLKNAFVTPLVSTIHATECGRNGGISSQTQKLIDSIEWWVTYESWRVIVNSYFMKEHVKNAFSLPADKIDVIKNAVDCDDFDCLRDVTFRRRYALDEEKIVFFIGRMVKEKGVQVLLEAVPLVLNAYRTAKFVLAGKGPMLGFLKEKCEKMGISHKVYFTGYIEDEDLKRLYGCIDVMVVPSMFEPFGITALEGMASGVPVIVSDCGGLGEIVENGTDGLKCIAGSKESLAQCILQILKNEQIAAAISDRATKKARSEFTWRAAAEKTQAVYERVLWERKAVDWS